MKKNFFLIPALFCVIFLGCERELQKKPTQSLQSNNLKTGGTFASAPDLILNLLKTPDDLQEQNMNSNCMRLQVDFVS